MTAQTPSQPLRFHTPHGHLASAFGSDWFGLKAESFARFFGTPGFLLGQSALVLLWIALNVAGVVHFDLYPFILLNLAFSLQAAYAAPLILLAQTRQADRDKAVTEADALHREALATTAYQQSTQLLALMQANTALTQATNDLTRRIETLTGELHRHLLETPPVKS